MERNNTHRRQTPSFSSILLHAIDRSIDEADGIGNTRVQTPCTCTCNRSRSSSTTPAAATYNKQQQQYGGTRNPKLRVKEKRFSSSEAESSFGGSLVDVSPTNKQKNKQKKKKKQDSKSLGNRFRASKLYAEIKKAKPPVSPGSRLASFVNQLFTSTGKTTTTNQNLIDRYRSYSTTSSSSSYLNKALSSKSLNNSKLTVRVDEEIVMDDDETRSYCSSSDLFELENLTGVGALDNYTNELPVYETTHLQTNRVIARRLIV